MTTIEPDQTSAVAPRRSAAVRQHAVAFALVRLTGVRLAVLVCGHFAVMHLFHDVSATNASFIARRWSQALWVAWDWLMLAAALLHGGIGIATAIRDYTYGRRRRALLTVLGTVTVALFVFGSVVIALGAGT